MTKQADNAWARLRLGAWRLVPSGLRGAIERRQHRHQRRAAQVRRTFAYEYSRLPNRYLAEVESASAHLMDAKERTGLSIGYPAWNLLYYALLCSLPDVDREVIVLETGTNQGFSSIVLAQALKDGGAKGIVRTVDVDARAVAAARDHILKAGLGDTVELNTGDSVEFLHRVVAEHGVVDFAFLDASHQEDDVLREFETVLPAVQACQGKVYFDNTSAGGVAQALQVISQRWGGNLIRFDNCSWSPPGNAIWQPHC